MNQFCTKCGTKLSHNDKFCTSCGATIGQKEASPLSDSTKQQAVKTQIHNISINAKNAASMVEQLMGSTAFASASEGEMIFTQAVISRGEVLTSVIGPVKYLFGGVTRIFKGFKEAIKNKKKLIPAIVLAVVWLLLSLLPLLGINPLPVKLLSFLTFAGGGTGTGLLGAIGGIFGKGLLAYFISALIMPAFYHKKPFAGIGGGIKNLFKVFTLKDRKTLAPLLVGVGMALIIYNFFTGNASLQNSMAGIVAFVLSLRALSNKTGFLRGFILSIVNKFCKVKTQSTIVANRIMAGFTTGFVVSVLLSATKIRVICYLVGIAFLIAAIVFGILSSRDRKVAAR